MTIKIGPAKIPDILVIEPEAFPDERGFLQETYSARKYKEAGIFTDFVQDNRSRSLKGVIRGLHFQLEHPQAKIVTVIKGEIFDVAVDIRVGSPYFGQWAGFFLSGENNRQVFIPEGFAHGLFVLSESAEVLYKFGDYYEPHDQHGVLWSDPDLGIDWPDGVAIISEKDRILPHLKDIPDSRLPRFS